MPYHKPAAIVPPYPFHSWKSHTMVRQCHTLIENTRWQLWQKICGTSKQNRRRLSRNTSQGKNQPCDNVRHPHRQNDVPDRLQLRCPQGPATFTHTVGNGFQSFLRCPNDQRYTKQPNVKEPAKILSPNPI